MQTISLALRNLLRNRRRSLATLSAMAIGVMSILLFGGFSANIKLSMETAHVRSGGHFQIQHKDFNTYGTGNPTAYGIADADRIIHALRSDPWLAERIAVVTPILQFGGIAGNYGAEVSRTVIGVGLIADDHARMREWNEFGTPVVSEPLRLKGAAPDSAVVGTGVARVLQLCEALHVSDCPQPTRGSEASGGAPDLPDDIALLSAQESKSRGTLQGATMQGSGSRSKGPSRRIELLASSARGTPNVASLDVIFAENQGIKALDDVYIALHLPQAQRLIYGTSAPRVTAIMVQLKRSDQARPSFAHAQAKLQEWALGQPLALVDFPTLNPFYVQTIQLFDTIFGFIFALIGSIVLFTVSNTMNTAVVERTVEIGTLRAIGLRRAGVQQMFVAEGVLLGAAGTIAGAALALLMAAGINRMGFQWLPPGNAGMMPLVLRVWGETGMILGTMLGLALIATLSAWWPAYRAARLNVVDALRHV